MAKDTDKGKKIPRALFSGTIEIGEHSLPAYVLEDETRVFSTRGMLTSLGYKENSNANEVFNSKTLKPYMLAHGNPYSDKAVIEFRTDLGVKARGYDVEKFLDVCQAISEAFDRGELKGRNALAGLQANAILRATSKVGIIALVDEATGYQYVRQENALQFKLKLYLAEEMRAWEKTFPDLLWIQFAKLTGYEGDATKRRPRYWGYLVMEYIYRSLEPDVANYIKENKPPARKGRNYHQYYNEEYGVKALTDHINQVIGVARACDSLDEFKKRMDYEFKGKPLQLEMFLKQDFDQREKPTKIDMPFDKAMDKIAKAEPPKS